MFNLSIRVAVLAAVQILPHLTYIQIKIQAYEVDLNIDFDLELDLDWRR